VFNKPSIFETGKPAADDDDNEGVEAENEAPIYAEGGNAKVEFKKGVEIQKSPYTRTFEQKVQKFKIVAPKDRLRKMDNGTLSLEFMEIEGRKSFILVFRTIRPMYVGTLVATSKIRRVEEKSHKHQIKTSQVFTDPKDNKKVLSYCTINFSKFEDMETFEKEYKKAVESLPKPKTA